MKYLLLCLLSLSPALCFSQTGVPETAQATHLGSRPLPPSIVAELQRTQHGHVLVFRDTVAASDIAKEHFNDSGANFADTGTAGFSDSVISMIDTAVSIPHKEWLDSELVEIPELARFGNRIHFNYSPAILVETNLMPVPFDSTLLAQMNPVVIEDLPFFDQSPIPMPLTPARNFESFLEAGVGNVTIPQLTCWHSQALSERSAIDLLGNYQNLSAASSAIHSWLDLAGKLDLELGPDPALSTFHSNALTLRAGFTSKNVADSNTSTAAHALSDFSAAAAFEGNVSQGFHYDAQFSDNEFGDSYTSGASESSQELRLGTRFDLSSWRIDLAGNYSRAGLTADTVNSGISLASSSSSINSESLEALLGRRGAVTWDAGLKFLGGGDLAGSHSAILPVAHLRLPLNARWEIGAAFEPNVQLASLRALTEVNPFYSPELVVQYRTTDTTPIDARSAVFDKINLTAYMNYMLSPDDELRLEARYLTRDREPIFDVVTTRDSSNIFTVTTQSTTRFSFLAAANFLLFSRDVLSGSAEFISATIPDQGRAIPFEPDFKLTAEYHFNSLWEHVQPSIAFRTLSRPDRTLTFLDATFAAEISTHLSGELRLQNILDGQSDFWPGYPEYPQSFRASVRFSF